MLVLIVVMSLSSIHIAVQTAFNNYWKGISSHEAELKGVYSVFMVDRAISVCNLLAQKVGQSPIMI